MRRNALRELLTSDTPSIGTHLHSSWPAITELVGLSGNFDYIEFVAAYGPYDIYALENIGRAIELFGHMTGMMKVEQGARMYWAAKATQCGIQNVLFEDVRTPADALACVQAVRAEAPNAEVCEA
jgi:2-keto-3-deoxy-L-rhamnonate aldolase RhmA